MATELRGRSRSELVWGSGLGWVQAEVLVVYLGEDVYKRGNQRSLYGGWSSVMTVVIECMYFTSIQSV